MIIKCRAGQARFHYNAKVKLCLDYGDIRVFWFDQFEWLRHSYPLMTVVKKTPPNSREKVTDHIVIRKKTWDLFTWSEQHEIVKKIRDGYGADRPIYLGVGFWLFRKLIKIEECYRTNGGMAFA